MMNKYIYLHELDSGSERHQRWKLRRKWRDENRKPGATQKARLFVGILWEREKEQRMPVDESCTLLEVVDLRSQVGTKLSSKSFKLMTCKKNQRSRKQADLKITNNNSKQRLRLC